MNVLQNALAEKNIRNAERSMSGVAERTAHLMAVNEKDRRVSVTEKQVIQAYQDAAEAFTAAESRLRTALDKLVDAEAELQAKSKNAISRSKDVANQLGDSLARVNKMLGPDFELRLAQLERLASAMTALNAINQEGKLDALLTALAGKR